MPGIRPDPELEAWLDRLAKETGRTKSYYATQAIKGFLRDREDYLLGVASLERDEPRTTLADLEERTWPGALNPTRQPNVSFGSEAEAEREQRPCSGRGRCYSTGVWNAWGMSPQRR